MIYVGLALTCLLGRLVLPRQLESAVIPRLGFGFAAGAFAISLQMFAYDLAGLSWGVLTLLLPWACWAGFLAYRHRGRLALRAGSLSWRRPAWWQVLLLACLSVPIVLWLPYERLMPLTSQSWDAWAIWLFKAKAFYLDGGIAPFLERSSEFTTQPGYPLLVPLYGAFLYVLNGGVADQAAKAMSPCFFLALLAVFYHFARRFGMPKVALVTTVMLATVPMVGVVAFELAGYADTTLSLYLVAAAGFLYGWYREGNVVDLAGASLAATAAAWTKNEGQFFLPAVVVLAAAGMIAVKGPARRSLWLAVPPLVVLLPWWLVRQAHGVEAAGFTLGVAFRPALFSTALDRLAGPATEVSEFNLTFYLLVAAAVMAGLLKLPKAFWILPGLVVWQLLGALLAYSTGRNEIEWWLGTSAQRILVQVVPLALLPVAVVLSSWVEAAGTAQEEPAEQTRKTKARRGKGRKGR